MSEEKKVGYLFNANWDLGNGRSLSISGNLPVEADADHFNRELDKVVRALGRQRSILALPAMKESLEKGKAHLNDQLKALGKLREQHSTKTGDKIALERTEQAVQQITHDVQGLEQEIHQIETTLNEAVMH
ncbi:MAG: hypothetical protein ACYCOR_17875 [Acidobacteriaceae bacterium]